ncbi:MAG TPA: amidase family protein, partial [Bacteroidota bacterium]
MSHRLTFDTTRRSLESGATSVERVTGEFLDAVAAGKRLNAFLSVFQDQAMEQARAVDRKLAAGKGGALAGMVVAVKDVLCMTGQRTTCGSKMLENFVSVYDATAVSRLRAADAVLIGKTNMDEFAMGSSTEN